MVPWDTLGDFKAGLLRGAMHDTRRRPDLWRYGGEWRLFLKTCGP